LIETSILRVSNRVEKYKKSRDHIFADSAALKDIQQHLHKELWQASNGQTLDANSKTKGTVPLSGHLVETINDFSHQQRVKQVAHYLEILNQRAIAKKKLLQTLFELWNATKMLLRAPSPGKTNRPTSSREEIILQTRALQDRLLEDMQHRPNIKTLQVQ
jgi:hypothetical protein